jgi:hypothetical protein
VPLDWKEAVAALAYVFHFQLTELGQMDIEDLQFWVERAKWVTARG